MEIRFTSAILILGSIHGILLAIFLLAHTHNRRANKVLGVLLVVFAVTISSTKVINAYYPEYPHLILSTFPMLLLLGPLLLIYALQLISPQAQLDWRSFIHLTPFVLTYLYLTPVYLKAGADKIAFYESFFIRGIPVDFVIMWGLQNLHLLIYLCFVLRTLQMHERNLKEEYSSIEKINLAWLRTLTAWMGGIWAVHTIFFTLMTFGIRLNPFGITDYLFGWAMSVVVYAVGYMALKRPEVFSGRQDQGEDTQSQKYERSGLSPERAKQYIGRLVKFVESEKPYRQGDLTLQHLAKKISVPPNHLSQIINEHLNQNFFDFVNRYRVEEIQSRLNSPAEKHLTILALAYDAGFNSKSAFYSAFKKHTNMTPSRFKRQVPST